MSLYLGTLLLCCLCASVCTIQVSIGLLKTEKCDQDPCADCLQKTDLDTPENDSPGGHAEQKQTNFLLSTPKKRVYRSINGMGNNKKHPTWGSANSGFRRLTPPRYEDKRGLPRMTDKKGDLLPSSRTVSRVALTHQVYQAHTSTMSVALAQFVSHDIGRFEPGESSGNCCDEDSNSTEQAENGGNCFPIMLDDDEDFYINQTCKNFVRSAAIPGSEPREQSNQLPTFLDLSPVYGTSVEASQKLRGENGTLRTAGNNMLPNETGTCRSNLPGNPCLIAGHPAVNQWVGMGCLHLTWFRMHLLISELLTEINPCWDSDKLFEEARSINIGIFQNVVYSELLPVLLNDETMVKYKLRPGQCVYDEKVDIRAIHEFVGACYRFGHSTVPNEIHVGETVIPMVKAFNNPDAVITHPDEVAVGLATYPAEGSDNFFTPAISGRLFERNEKAKDGSDLVSTNNQRGRDHGYPPYNEFRKFIGLKPISDFDTDVFWKGHKLGCVYKHVDDIDLFPGAMTEVPLKGSAVGPTCAHVIGTMFHALKCGDRFFHHVPPPEGFTNEQRKVIQSFTLAKVLCLVMEIKKLQKHVLVIPDPLENPRICCSSYEKLDLSPWKEKCLG